MNFLCRDDPVVASGIYLGLFSDLKDGDGAERKTRARMEKFMKKVAGNVMEKTINLKEKVAKFIESDEEWDDDQR